MNEILVMSPGPTEVHEEVRKSMARPMTIPDGHPDFLDYYFGVANKLKKVFKTKNDIRILNGEGILGLEAAMASLIDPGDKVLCIENGLFGKTFGEMAEKYGGDVYYFSCDNKKPIDINTLEKLLKEQNAFKFATLVHCETPTGVINNIEKISILLKKHGILSVVDAVSTLGGEKLETDEWNLDLVIAGSQKCLSASSGLVMLSISQDAWVMISNKKKKIPSLYTNLLLWKDIQLTKTLPYSQPIHLFYGLETALDRWNREDVIARHNLLGNGVKQAVINAGLSLYPDSGFSNTISAVEIPQGITYKMIQDELWKEHKIFISTSLGNLSGKVLRIGHMGENCSEEKLYRLFKALTIVLKKYGVFLKEDLHKAFVNALSK
ncbi:pyridoxal-phosphate-dependent aminotransferase family protein [Isachenkonia alkalipeptolytica]|uniref:Alanine--glyoxylate aminotransferase family protein n=1 Tax=Isachenkonia alkalipeptolytica TaxID=2565777 RepID=A0AA44BGQ9_9CLOT|nr:alanine--glyoxylate aminotransferase family protein [Isachenkonia alkalipeptolytica]NBG89501.1 alanine--glyoxylate aminotransferase family protein [Isachenkonia alkalipeptolytica]